MDTWQLVFLFFTAIVIHEAGHLAAAWILRYPATLKLRWWGIQVMLNKRVKIPHLAQIGIAGIFPGLFFVMMFNEQLLLFAYILASGIDIISYIQCITLKMKGHKGYYLDAMYEYVKEERDKEILIYGGN